MSTDLPTPAPTPRPAPPPEGAPEPPSREIEELGDDEDLPTEPGRDGEVISDGDQSSQEGAATAGEPMTFRDADGRVHLSADMHPADRRRAEDAPAVSRTPLLGLLRA
ncbi:hypothetical protein [Devosia sp. A16]|uniref:hypothetical protein n=1 Tax=Devosia sp. A16 TaxID=1736675 RepID=UPI0006D7E9F1|nr:hypothetical protein [Devosia sp. A16]